MCLFGGGSAPPPPVYAPPPPPPAPPIIVRAPEPTLDPTADAGPSQSAPAMAGGNKTRASYSLRIRRPGNAKVSAPINVGQSKVGLNIGK